MAKTEKEKTKKIQKLIELNDDLENYFLNTIIPQLFVDANLVLRKFTPVAMKQFKFSPKHIGRPIEDLKDNIKYSTITKDIQEVIDSGEILEKEIQTTDECWFEMNIIPYVIKKSGKTNGVILTFVDITGRINTLKELERLNDSHETFIYSVSHDLKAPLNNIEGLVELLIHTSEELAEKKIQDHKQQIKFADMLNDSIESMRNIINELADIAKIKGNYQEQTETLSFESILQEVVMTVKDKINESKAEVHIDVKTPEINFSRKNLRSILYNLLSNAIKYKAPGRIPEIYITIEKEKEFVKISVKDNGKGIAKDKQDLIFEQFTRIEKQVEGSGIGLYLVKKIVENAEGKIVVSSKDGKGSEFKVYLKHKD